MRARRQDIRGNARADRRYARPYECLVKAVLAWTGPDTLAERDHEKIALQLTGHARDLAP
ncbi:hypothetical protein GCM10023324_19780 [Streptomyces youssoufiensis]